MKKWIAGASRLFFKGLHVTEALFGLPKSISDSLHFRENWEQFLVRASPVPTLWIHGASVGELEDLANFFLNEEALKEAGYDSSRLVVTASSPSAKPFLERLRQRGLVIYAGPIPSEDPQKITSFLETLQPELLVLSHSDLWPNLMLAAQERALARGIVWMPAKASSATSLFENVVRPEKLIAVGVRSAFEVDALRTRLSNYSSSQIVWIGNPRLDRIASRILDQQSRDHHVLEESRARPDNRKLSLLMGSAWPEDAAVLAEALKALSTEDQARIQIVVIPHVTDDMHVVASIQHLLPMARILRIQGVLLEAYQDFDLAFVGGGFRTGLHSVLEPALWGLPIFCGPQLRKQIEAPELEALGALHPIVSAALLSQQLSTYLSRPEALQAATAASRAASDKMKASTGASKRLSHLLGASRIGRHVRN
ncbi:MAG: glycosyltransferase N-terminal domain-containing protein [Bdellovibrionota bacterium]